MEYYKWKSKELEVIRLKKSYETYEKINNTTISKLIEIANNQLINDFTDTFIVFEKVAGYFGANFFNFLLGFFMATIKVDLAKNFGEHLNLFFEIYLIQILIVLGYHFAKSGHLIDKKSKKTQLQDYIFVLENILLIKEV